MIIPNDIKEFVENYISNYIQNSSVNKNYSYRVINESPLIRNDIVLKLKNHYDLKDSILDDSSLYYLNQYVKKQINIIVNEYFDRLLNKKNIEYRLEKLKKLVLPEQRSPKWYKMTDTMLTASSLADYLGKGHFKNKR